MYHNFALQRTENLLTLQCNREGSTLKDILRDGAVVARWAHNPKVSRSSRLPATKFRLSRELQKTYCGMEQW